MISISPSSLSIYEGDAIEIYCTATGNPAPEISWSRTNRRPINNQYQYYDGLFMIRSARLSDQGEYRYGSTFFHSRLSNRFIKSM